MLPQVRVSNDRGSSLPFMVGALALTVSLALVGVEISAANRLRQETQFSADQLALAAYGTNLTDFRTLAARANLVLKITPTRFAVQHLPNEVELNYCFQWRPKVLPMLVSAREICVQANAR